MCRIVAAQLVAPNVDALGLENGSTSERCEGPTSRLDRDQRGGANGRAKGQR